MVARENRLRTALAELDSYDFDYVFIDCPPSLGLLTINALVAARRCLSRSSASTTRWKVSRS
ncbi:cobQ/CobB/MinD/ParA nucleotide binding domain protein [Mycobacterium xenopi 3993]|nr:cobQ/CobB/MinD/ParA nucleotide binding domain protein [Mycobacterium xenopi 3993]